MRLTSQWKSPMNSRNNWLMMSDQELIRDCQIKNYKSSGPGGQRKNKVATAVRLTHLPSNITVTASESRHQHENRLKAIQKLRMEIALKIRQPDAIPIDKLEIGIHNKKFSLWASSILDTLNLYDFHINSAAEKLNISTSKLVRLLSKHPAVWQEVNNQRKQHGLRILKKPE